ncbi:hypothetical protein NBO_555g0002 [Nosema bombycis CQ1]|uniref:Uncharacterized protein n=1 Tax=Nosema bombycis (strain CQ1 / CVCC 102059) TaxID=578461 RepID=R0MDC8_NOSB1|nr:hypothetical protein NBO_555g0002 [Nosema bombycis CQ1]|eukprot:EOB12080.1 hypothetical protein NBO_555g0002 [Nosema bombycis CQ1]
MCENHMRGIIFFNLKQGDRIFFRAVTIKILKENKGPHKRLIRPYLNLEV